MSVENVASENTGAASTAAAEPPNAPDETLLDVALARFGEFRMHRCSRLVLAAQLHAASAAKADDLAEFVLGFLETQSKRVDVKGYLSGMLLTIAQRGVLIVIEAPTKVINLFLRELKQREAAYALVAAKHQVMVDAAKAKLVAAAAAAASSSALSASASHKPGFGGGGATLAPAKPVAPAADALPAMPAVDSPLLSGAHVLAMHEEVTHEFRHFSVRHAAVSGKAEHEDFARIDGGNLVFDACTAVLATGRALSATDDPEVAQECFQRGVAPPPTAVGGSAEGAAPAPASSKPLPLPTKLPMSVEHVTALCAVSLAMTVDEYLAEFDSPVQYTLESELTWPMEPFIKY